ncbi:MAG: AlpA family phage regulatory protein [Rhodospirillales bacterium]|nr:AlpA family phage regulatory protein [Rhodospirillales bacterium]
MLRREAVHERTRLSRSVIYRLIQESDFPLPHRVGQRAVRRRESDLEAWLASRPLARGRKVNARPESMPSRAMRERRCRTAGARHPGDRRSPVGPV